METGNPALEEDAPDPKVAALRKEIEEWGTKTTIGVLAGMLYGGSKEAFDSSKDGNLLLPIQAESKDLNQRRKILKDMMEKRVLRIASGTVLGGAKLGAFTAIFCGVQHGLAVQRNIHDTMNVVAAGAITAAAFGLALPGSIGKRLKAALLGTTFGALACLPLGYAYTTLQQQSKPDDLRNSLGFKLEHDAVDSDAEANISKHLEDSSSERQR